MIRPALLLSVGLFALAGCVSDTAAPLGYAPAGAFVAAAPRPLVQVDPTVLNLRQTGAESADWIGTIRGGYGNPLKRLRADRPVAQVVEQAFRDGLAARGLAAPGAEHPYVLSIVIHQFDANQYLRREATADFSVMLVERATGREVWRDRHKAYTVDGSVLALTTGIFADIEDLRVTARTALGQAIDTLLDRPGFRAALGA